MIKETIAIFVSQKGDRFDMKKSCVIMITALSLVATFNVFGMRGMMKETETDNRSLTTLWKQYETVRQNDRPQEQAKILEGIKKVAVSQGCYWDFWNAGEKYVEVKSRRNWKLRDSLTTAFCEEVEAIGVPLMKFTMLKAYKHKDKYALLDYALLEQKRLTSQKNSGFYFSNENYEIASGLESHLPEYINNDWEYALWQLSALFDFDASSRSCSELADVLGNSYPAGAYLKYRIAAAIGKSDTRKNELENVSSEFQGRAVGLLAEADLLWMKKEDIDNKNSTSHQYQLLRTEAADFETSRHGLKGDDGRIMKKFDRIKSMIDELDSEDTFVSVYNDTAIISFKNMPSAELIVCKDNDTKAAFLSRHVDNPIKSYYLRDTVTVPLPAFDDGDYIAKMKNGKHQLGSHYFGKHTISLAGRWAGRNYGIYAADYVSGKPYSVVDLSLWKNGKEIKTLRDFQLNEGFTNIPDEFLNVIKENRSVYQIMASLSNDGIKRLSPKISLSDRYYQTNRDDRNVGMVKIFTDRGAYVPGDSVAFKAILYGGNPYESFKVVKEGMSVNAVLRDSERKKLTEMGLKTNNFGAVAGAFSLPKGLRGGNFYIDISAQGYEGTKSFRVDEFVLPTFNVDFEQIKTLYQPGDTVIFRGNIKAYSGHSLSSARVGYTATSYNKVISEGLLSIAEDGGFRVDVPTDEEKNYQYISLNVKVTDATGETHDYFFGTSISKDVNIRIKVLDAEDGVVKGVDDSKSYVMTCKSSMSVRMNLYSNGNDVSGTLSYVMKDSKGTEIMSGRALSGDVLVLDLKGCNSGLYTLTADYKGKIDVKQSITFLKIGESDRFVDAAGIDHFFMSKSDDIVKGEDIRVLMSCPGAKELMAVAEVYDLNSNVLDKRLIHLTSPREIYELTIPYKLSWTSDVNVTIFYFREGKSEEWSHNYHAEEQSSVLPLSFVSFEDKTLPKSRYTFVIKTLPGVECVASVYDKSVDNIARNDWHPVSLHKQSASNPGYDVANGRYGSNMIAYAEGTVFAKRAMSRSALATSRQNFIGMADMAIEEPTYGVMSEDAQPTENVSIRSDFANTLAFEPFIHSDAEGNMELNFTTSDKLSTYYVSLFAHARDMLNAVRREEFMVSLPVKVSVAQPQYLYVGDKYKVAVSVSSSKDSPIDGTLWLYQYDGVDYEHLTPISVKSEKISVSAKSSSSFAFDVAVPEVKSEIGLKAVFVADSFSDGVFVSVPVCPAEQTLTETHSAVVLEGMSENEITDRLRTAFVNVDAADATVQERSVIDMIRDAIPTLSEPVSDNVADLLDSYYVRLLSGRLGVKTYSEQDNNKLLERILACRNADGGFSWFEGMSSSPMMTALALERFHKLHVAGLVETLSLESSVRFLDKCMFDVRWPYWCGGISVNQYLYVRSLYPETAFNVKPNSHEKEFEKRMTEFRKYVRDYLTPKKARGYEGRILDKALRLKTLGNLMKTDEGLALAKAWNINAVLKLKNSYSADVISLLEYSVNHRDGGVYYPNAVMPFRGLLESEAYAHSLLCDLLTDVSKTGYLSDINSSEALRVADGIRIWLMLQKETQEWGDDPAFVDAINSVMCGSDNIKRTKVISLSKTFFKPFEKVKASGNGFSVERKFYRIVPSTSGIAASAPDKRSALTEQEIDSGTMLNVGDKIRVDYKIWNQENRSFIRLSAPREASLRPVVQLSGRYGMSARSMRLNGWFSFSPGGYRDVRADRTYYYFDSFPEEVTTISEEFFVTQSGAFLAPAVEIESLYSPHYRANASFSGILNAK